MHGAVMHALVQIGDSMVMLNDEFPQHGSFGPEKGKPVPVTIHLYVKDVDKAFERASNRKVAYRVVRRRPGDIAVCYADATRAQAELGWRATRGLDAMCDAAWRWQHGNPDGYP